MGASYLQMGKEVHPSSHERYGDSGPEHTVGSRPDRHSGTAFGPYAHLPERRQVLHVDYGKELSSQGQAGTQQGALRALCRHTQYDPKFGLYTVNQYSTRRPVHRQFIGFSPKTDDYIAAHFIDMIFKGFPHQPL